MELARTFRFRVSLRRAPQIESGSGRPGDTPGGAPLGDGGFQEVSGLDLEMDVQELLEGGRNDGVIRRVGRAKYSPLVLKRGMFYGGAGGGLSLGISASASASVGAGIGGGGAGLSASASASASLSLGVGTGGGGGGVNRELWEWLQGVTSGVRPVARYDGVIEVLGYGQDVVATWVFDRGLPARISGPRLDAKTGDIAIEELQIAHEGLRLVAS